MFSSVSESLATAMDRMPATMPASRAARPRVIAGTRLRLPSVDAQRRLIWTPPLGERHWSTMTQTTFISSSFWDSVSASHDRFFSMFTHSRLRIGSSTFVRRTRARGTSRRIISARVSTRASRLKSAWARTCFVRTSFARNTVMTMTSWTVPSLSMAMTSSFLRNTLRVLHMATAQWYWMRSASAQPARIIANSVGTRRRLSLPSMARPLG
mmetsp:Transcript_16271/g.56134  ORF Transcript_16271/g.56134 Transcript_16271/m.56134 type:complete len:211 (+) Transcript_16271:1302-1934(+)